eukprot:250132_1
MTSESKSLNDIKVMPVHWMIEAKIKIIDFREKQKDPTQIWSQSQRYKFRKAEADKLRIGYINLPKRDLLLYPLVAGCHLLLRCVADKFGYKFTQQRRLDKIRPTEEIAEIGKRSPSLLSDAKKIQRLNLGLPKTEYLKTNWTARKAKELSYIAVDVAKVTDNRIQEDDPNGLLKRRRNIAFLFAIESVCHVLHRVQDIDANAPWNEPTLLDLCEDGVLRFKTLYQLDPKICTPSMYRCLIIAPRCKVLWRYYMNRKRKLKYLFPLSMDEGTEHNGKSYKQYNANSSNNKRGYELRLLSNMVAANIGALEYMLNPWHITAHNKDNYHKSFFNGLFDLTGFHPLSKELMSKARSYDLKPLLSDWFNTVDDEQADCIDPVEDFEEIDYLYINGEIDEDFDIEEYISVVKQSKKKRKKRGNSKGITAKKKPKKKRKKSTRNTKTKYIDSDDSDY